MARPTGSCPPGRKPLLSDRETALGRRSFRPSPCRGRHPSSPRRRGGSNIHSYFWPMWLKYSFPLVAQILVPTWLKYSLTFTVLGSGVRVSYAPPSRKALKSLDFRAFSYTGKGHAVPLPDAIFDATSSESNNFRHRCHALALNIRIAVHIFLHRKRHVGMAQDFG